MSRSKLLQAPPSLSGPKCWHPIQLCPRDLSVDIHLQWCYAHYAMRSQVCLAPKCPKVRQLQIFLVGATIASVSIASVPSGYSRCKCARMWPSQACSKVPIVSVPEVHPASCAQVICNLASSSCHFVCHV